MIFSILIAPQYDMPKFLLKVQKVLFKFMPESQFKDIGLTKKDFIALTNSMANNYLNLWRKYNECISD